MKYFMLAILAAAVSFTVGCTPKLANRELGPEEQEWKEYLEGMYPGWEVPGTLPPAISDRYEKDPLAADKLDDGFGVPENAVTEGDKDFTATTSDDVLTTVEEPEISKVRYEDYVVEKDDSLSTIAKKVYGNGRKYYRIYKANEDVIKNPNRIYPGMKLRIPRP